MWGDQSWAQPPHGPTSFEPFAMRFLFVFIRGQTPPSVVHELSAHGATRPDLQSITCKPATRENSTVLFVTSTAPRLSAVPAMSKSSGPIVNPCLSSSIRIFADAVAASESNGTRWIYPSPRSNSRLRRSGSPDRIAPNSNSYTTIAGRASSVRAVFRIAA